MAYFTPAEIDHFKEHGYVRKQDVVEPKLLDKAVDRFWDDMDLDREDPDSWSEGGRKGNLPCGSHPDVRATLTDTPIQDMAEELVGKDTLQVSNYTFAKPVYPTGKPSEEWVSPEHGHLDGHGLIDGSVQPFTVAVTVNLAEVKPKAGGFTIWPGTHRRVHEYFRNHSILSGMKSLQDEDGNWDNLPEAVENPGPPGAVVFWHNKMMHSAGNNCGQDIRLACVSRFSRKDLNEIQFEMPEDMWKYWAI
jgi:hypothetical protein